MSRDECNGAAQEDSESEVSGGKLLLCFVVDVWLCVRYAEAKGLGERVNATRLRISKCFFVMFVYLE